MVLLVLFSWPFKIMSRLFFSSFFMLAKPCISFTPSLTLRCCGGTLNSQHAFHRKTLYQPPGREQGSLNHASPIKEMQNKVQWFATVLFVQQQPFLPVYLPKPFKSQFKLLGYWKSMAWTPLVANTTALTSDNILTWQNFGPQINNKANP